MATATPLEVPERSKPRARGRLQLLLTDYQTATIPVQLVCPAGRRPTPKTLRFVEFCARQLRGHPALLTE